MITKSQSRNSSDIIGVVSSSLCLIHCIATPFVFIAQSSSAVCCESSPIWWQSIDYIFLVISFFAVFWSVKHTSKSWMKSALWLSWVALSAAILNEKFELIHLPEISVYIPALALIGLHVYNKKYCQCKDDDTCCNTL